VVALLGIDDGADRAGTGACPYESHNLRVSGTGFVLDEGPRKRHTGGMRDHPGRTVAARTGEERPTAGMGEYGCHRGFLLEEVFGPADGYVVFPTGYAASEDPDRTRRCLRS
jgi:hypothetical protein